jgi:hypothetical protein
MIDSPDQAYARIFGTTMNRNSLPWNHALQLLGAGKVGTGNTLQDLIAALGTSQVPQLPGPYQQNVGQVGSVYDQAMQQTRALEAERSKRLDQLHAAALQNAQLAQQANKVGEQAAQQAAAQTQVLAQERARQGYDPMMADLAAQGVTGAPAQMLAQQQTVAQQDVGQRAQAADARNAQDAVANRQVEAMRNEAVNDTDNLARTNLSSNVGQTLQALLGAKTKAVGDATAANAQAAQAAALQQAQLAMQERASDSDRIGKALQAAAQANTGVFPGRQGVMDQVHKTQLLADMPLGAGRAAVPWAQPTIQIFNAITQQASDGQEALQMLQGALTDQNKATRQLANSANQNLLKQWINDYYRAAPNQIDPQTFQSILAMYGAQ